MRMKDHCFTETKMVKLSRVGLLENREKDFNQIKIITKRALALKQIKNTVTFKII